MLSSILFLNLLFAADLTCSKGRISQFSFGKTHTETSEFCYNRTKDILVSRSCESKRCMAYSSKQKFAFKDLYSEYGKPGFVLCRKLGGEPQIIDFYVGKTPYKLDRCTFADGGFVDTGFLLRHYLN